MVQQIPEAADNPTAGVGEIFYINYGIFAEKKDAGTAESAFHAYMLLNRDRVGKHIEPGTKIYGLLAGERDDGYVQTANITDDEGRLHELQLVSTRRASVAQFMRFYDVTLMNPKVLCGIFSGVLMVFLFCALTMKAVGRAAYRMMFECRRQFDKMRDYLIEEKNMPPDQAKDPANWPMQPVDFQGQRYPDYANCVHISTVGAQKEMIFPSLLAIIIPILIGLVFGVQGVMGLLVGGLTSGFAVAIFMANAGGAWDNAKKWIELGHHGGPGSDAHKAGVVGDTVGDPFKDTSGPSLNILIKLISMVSVVFAGLVVKYAPIIGSWIGLG